MTTHKVHLIVAGPLDVPGRNRTGCGFVGRPARDLSGEYETVYGGRFEAVRADEARRVTCGTCRRRLP